MSERPLEDRLFEAVWQRNEADVRLAISTALTLARREGFHMVLPLWLNSKQVEERLPLPTRTVRKLR